MSTTPRVRNAQITQMEDDLAAFETRLEKLRERIPALHAELSQLDAELTELADQVSARGQNGHKKTKNELLTRRAMLESELASLPGQAHELKLRAVHADLLLLRTQREFHRAEAYRLEGKYASLDSQFSKVSLAKRHIIVQARHGHIGRDAAAVQTEPLTTELKDLEPHVKTARAELNRAQGRAARQADIAKMRYRVSLDAAPEKWDQAAQRLADEEKAEIYRLCFPWWPWPKPWQGRI